MAKVGFWLQKANGKLAGAAQCLHLNAMAERIAGGCAPKGSGI